ncbi:MAG TPA: hypothetical protein VHG72_22030 [Polyangia bacterium]|nr:hypothetical protein [Polyangia bacterium]
MAILSRFWRGWMLEALFGQTTARSRWLFLSLVGAAIVWPVLLFGILVPKLAVQILSFVPLPDTVPAWTVRLVWIALAVLIPLAVGIAVTTHAPPTTRRGPLARRVLRGYPITVGVTVSFGIIFLSVPVIQVAALIRKRRSIAIPLIMDASAYRQVTRRVCEVLNQQGFSFQPAQPGWWITMPIRVLTRLGGDVLRAHMPDRLEHFETEDLTMSLYPSGLLLQGKPERLTWAHGLIAEAVVHTDGLQTTDPKALVLERRLRPLWRRYDADPGTCPGDADLQRDLDRLTRDLKTLQVDWDDWQVLYRQLLQLARAIHGEPPLLASGPPAPIEAATRLRGAPAARPQHT